MSPTHDVNVQNNSWTVITEFPTDQEIQDKTKEKIYEAALWARKDEEIIFSANFGRGSHMNITWSFDSDANDEDNTYNDDCKTKVGDPVPKEETAGNGPVHHHQLHGDQQETVDAGEYLGQQLLPGDKR